MRALRTLPLCAVFLLAGCNSIKVHLGLRLHIAKLPITSIVLTKPGDPGMAPGEQSKLIATLTDATGKTLVTEGAGKGKVLWADLAVTPTLVTVKKGTMGLRHDPRVSDGKAGHVEVTIPSHPGLKSDIEVPVRYDYPFAAGYAGGSGTNGSNGTDGIAGSSGSTGSSDPDNPSAGGSGGNGTSGSDGGSGSSGGDGPAVSVKMTLRAGSHPLLQFGVYAAGYRDRFFLVDPVGGTLTLTNSGGSGGAGGKGGTGGAGGSGGSGIPPGSSGSSGSNGSDGSSGSDGSPGWFTVTYDPSAQPYLAALHLNNGRGRATVFNQSPVAPLW